MPNAIKKAGRAAIEKMLGELGFNLNAANSADLKILEEVERLENLGYGFETALASLELFANRLSGRGKVYFELMDYRVADRKERDWGEPEAEAEVGIKVGTSKERDRASGVGPVDALNNALRKSLELAYPKLKNVKLTDYQVRVIPSPDGTAAYVRAMIESTDGKDSWITAGVSLDILEASWLALADSFNYKLYKDERKTKDKR